MTSTLCRVAVSIISIRNTDLCVRALTYLHRITSAFDDWPVIYFPDFSAYDLYLSSVPLPLVSPKILNILYMDRLDSSLRRLHAVCAATAGHLLLMI